MEEAVNMPDLAVKLGPLTLEHPIINASGTMNLFDLADKFGEDFLAEPPVAAYVPKTITLEPRPGNKPPRILETPGGMINAIGLSGDGLDAFVSKQLSRLLALPIPVILSIGGFSPDDYVRLARGLVEALDEVAPGTWPSKVGLELNISCPNVHSGCLQIGSDGRETESLVTQIRAVWRGLLIAKLTPNVTDIASIAMAAQAGGADSVAAVNTFKGLVIDRKTLKPLLGNTVGGLSGPAIKPLALRAVYEIASRVSVPVIGMGGVACNQDVLDFLSCGASCVAVGSAAFRSPYLARELVAGLEGELQTRNLELGEVIGEALRA